MAITLTDENFQEQVTDCPGLVLVEIVASWSGTFHIMAPIIEEIASEFSDRVKVGLLDPGSGHAIARTYRMEQVPTFLFFKDGKPVDVVNGIMSKSVLVERINGFLEPH
jgi:thioredoxin 1